ncbi:hypothetical protein J5E15_25500, partial [Klebsiella pneumoniae subsp. pneumoniae]|nr:hypothetical protein [Klebsiella pneumoniae subsp. pneumoniae]
GPDPRNFNQRVSLGRNDLLIRTFPNWEGQEVDFDDTTYRSSATIVYRVWDYTDVAIAHGDAFVQLTIKA